MTRHSSVEIRRRLHAVARRIEAHRWFGQWQHPANHSTQSIEILARTVRREIDEGMEATS